MPEVTTTSERLPGVKDPETGDVTDSDGDRLTVRYVCDCGETTEGTAVLYDEWDEGFREDVLDAVIETVREECCG